MLFVNSLFAVAILTGYIADRYAARGSTTITMGTMATIGFTIFLGQSYHQMHPHCIYTDQDDGFLSVQRE